MFSLPRLAAIVGTLLLAAGTPTMADTISCTGAPGNADSLCSTTATVIGSSFDVFAFEVAQGGSYDLTLTDFMWPNQALGSLSAMLTTSTRVLGSLSSAGSLAFFATPGTYFVQVSASVAPGATAGLYGVDITTALNPVPLPPAVLLLMSALGFFWVSRKVADATSRSQRSDPADVPGYDNGGFAVAT